MRPERSLIVCTLPRSGSTMLCDGLTQTDRLGYPAEYYSPAHRTYYDRLIGEKARDYNVVFDYCMRLGSTPNGVFATKVLFHQLVTLRRNFDLSDSYGGVEPLALLDDLLPNPHFLHLIRRDKLKQAISYQRAIESGVWWRLDQDRTPTAADGKPVYDRQTIAHWVRTMTLWDEAWQELLASVRGPVLTMYYDEVVGDFTGAIARVHDFLGVPYGDEIRSIAPGLKRQSDATTDEWARRFREADATLARV